MITPCLVWQGGKDHYGYGQRRSRNFRTLKVHRQIMAMAYGGEDAIEGQHVLHHCDNPPCFRFDHLYLGTQADNNRDMHSRGRWCNWASRATHCPQGHEYTGTNSRGARVCAICAREASRRYRSRGQP